MKLYNTPTKQVEKIAPQNPPNVTIYTCGPTVYDYTHVGHWFTYVRVDMLIRTLKLAGFQPKWIINITDVGHLVSDADEGEDKLEKGARREGKTAWEVADFYTKDFLEGMKELNITQPDIMPKATDHIAEQIALIQKLEEKGYTYVIDDGVYYDTSKFPPYADFAQLGITEQQAGVRVAVNEQKRNPTDFALWKSSPKNARRDMEWDSPWGKGFPGWHIECSAMSMKYLGETLDIHTGGIDHIPVHHTNEIAQSEAATGKKFVDTWMHANHVLINDEKISKSLGNSIRLADLKAKGDAPMALRLLILESHYRTQSHFSWETLEAAQNRLRSYRQFADLVWQVANDSRIDGKKETPLLDQAKQDITDALQDDLNTPQALAALSSLTKKWLAVVGEVDKGTLRDFLQFIDNAFGLDLLVQSHDITNEQQGLLNDRDDAKKNSDYARADEIKKDLQEKHGILVRDTQAYSFWYREY